MNFAIVILEVEILSISSNETIGRVPLFIQRIFYAIPKPKLAGVGNRKSGIQQRHASFHVTTTKIYGLSPFFPEDAKSHARWTEKHN